MTTDPRRPDVYMHISALPQTSSQSPEEIRIQDYVTTYSTTGRPPIPVPQDPAGERERVALGLPPLFQPHTEVLSGVPTTPTNTKSSSPFTLGAVKAITEPSQLPKIHAFQPLVVNEETFCSMSALPEFLLFSHEELRCYAYAAGVIFSPTPLPTDPATFSLSPISSLPSPPSPPAVYPFFAKDGSATAFFDEPNPAGPGILYYQTVSAGRRFEKHSLEELHVAFLRAGRELDSSQITPTPALAIAPSPSGTSIPTLFGTTGGAFAHSPAVRPF